MDPAVLVVEDDENVREAVRGLLGSCGFPTLGARNGAEALDLLEHVQPRLILLDLAMPVMDGWAFLEARRSRPRCAGLPVVVLSAFGSLQMVLRAGAQGYLMKPFDADQLLEIVESYCGEPQRAPTPRG